MVLKAGQNQALECEADHEFLLSRGRPPGGGDKLGDDLGPPLGHLGGGDAGLTAGLGHPGPMLVTSPRPHTESICGGRR